MTVQIVTVLQDRTRGHGVDLDHVPLIRVEALALILVEALIQVVLDLEIKRSLHVTRRLLIQSNLPMI